MLLDSGLGGLTVLAEVRKVLPNAPVIYVADYAALPYGEKTERQIEARVPTLLGRLVERYRPRLVTIACNTASTIALSTVREALDLPIVGTVPAIKPAAALTKTGSIGLLGTAATIRQAYVDNLEAEFAAGKRLIRHAAPALVQAAEAKLRGQPVDPAVFAEAAEGLRSQPGGQDIDTVVLACTHFPLVEDELRAAFGQPVQFVHGAQGIARRVEHLTRGQSFLRTLPEFAVFTGDLYDLSALSPALKVYGIDHVDRF
ncbi:glutamate racemase [Altericroceibacterium xinjiangense]|uniref:glutamate racemase n=1 Tax=Altericroceibacterium xinjiangense TaxID=762261 RepID=UPI000F7DE1E2|nr:glutamate racemase [Altericroceibacterium xinjiangense]